jgi:dsDNA-specific endonuclease/ATPase MutS2
MDLEAIPGVGAKTARRLGELDDPEGALESGDVAAIARAPGISEGRAARIARAAIRHRHGDERTFLATERAREVYRSALSLLQERAVTDYAERRLETLYPSSAESRIEEVRAFVADAMERDPDPGAVEALAGVEPLEPPRDVRVRDRCLATNDAETYSKARELVPELSVELVEDARGLAELARGYSTVIALDEEFAGLDVEGDVRVEPRALSDPASVVPERTLAFFARNRDRLRAASAVHRASSLDPPCDLDALESALSRLESDGTVAGDETLDALGGAVDDLDAAVSMAESVANDRLRTAIEERDVTIEGADLLSLVERGAGVDSLLRRELGDEYAAAVDAARDHLVDALSVEDYAATARRAFGDEPTFPVEAEDRVVSRLREELTAARDRRAAELKRELAADLADLRAPAADLVDAALDLDVELAVSRFARDFDCTVPSFGGEGFEIEGGRSPLLDVPFEDVEPVDYGVSGVALLSGVNSGGKTSTLDLVALVVVLAHMGLPVPAERARLERFEALHYQAKTQGTLDAGAFEATLREFGALAGAGGGDDGGAEGRGGRLVLVDELESITEPGASAVIIAGILEALAAGASTAVFVSHLAGEIRDAAAVDVAVDGIEAVGLEDGELVVERSPRKDHLARSTPELIVEKLAGEADSNGSGFYDRLLEKFEGG